MSDLLAPILFVIDNEVDAFWCFVAYMERVVSWMDGPWMMFICSVFSL